MKLQTGSRLGAYQITGFLASGGMGEVYKARHMELLRSVAIKVLPERMTRDEEAVRRFRREARAASALSHPNICTIYDFANDDGYSYLVMEYLEGETLAARLKNRKKLGITETLELGAEVADALDHAHQQGLVHRDLKPGNVMLTENGAKVLDFGLVKRLRNRSESDDAKDSESFTMTAEGGIVGTVPYMAPEQIEGEACDARTDIYALGDTLYESLTGQRPFAAPTKAALAAAILEGAAEPIQNVEPSTPPALVRTIDRCLSRDPKKRWQTARDLGSEFRWILESGSSSTTFLEAPGRAPRTWHRKAWGLAAALVVVLAFAWSRERLTGNPSESVYAFDLGPPLDRRFAHGPDGGAAISPDGKRVVLVTAREDGAIELWTKSLDGTSQEKIHGADYGGSPFWSPDGTAVGFFAKGSLQISSLDRRPPQALADVSTEFRGGSWGSDDILLYAPGDQGGLWTVSPRDSTPRQLTRPDRSRDEVGHMWPSFLPDGERFLYFVASPRQEVRGIYAASLEDPRGKRVLGSTASAIYAAGYLLHLDEQVLLASPFDPSLLAIRGDAIALAADVASYFTYQAAISASEAGVLVFSRAGTSELTRIRWTDAQGRTLERAGTARRISNPFLSRNGRYLASEIHRGTDSDIEVTELASGRIRTFQEKEIQEKFPVLSPDGGQLVYTVSRLEGSDLLQVGTHRSDPPRVILHSSGLLMPTDWSPDGKSLLLAELTSRGDYDLLLLAVEEPSSPERLASESPLELSGRFSPSGERIVYVSTVQGGPEVYAEPLPGTGIRCQISSGGGFDPIWQDEDVVLYLDQQGEMLRVRIDDLSTCSLGSPESLFQAHVRPPATSRNHYAWDGLGRRFLLNSIPDETERGQVAVIVSWPTMAKQSRTTVRP